MHAEIVSDKNEDYYEMIVDSICRKIPTMKSSDVFKNNEYRSDDLKFKNQLFANAVFYLNAAEILICHREKHTSAHAQELSPISMLLSFTCELFLKFLIIVKTYERNKCYGHNLNELYSKLDKTYKDKIKENTKDQDFNLRLIQHSEAFECIRYLHEKDITQVNWVFLLNFARVLKTVCTEVFCENA